MANGERQLDQKFDMISRLSRAPLDFPDLVQASVVGSEEVVMNRVMNRWYHFNAHSTGGLGTSSAARGKKSQMSGAIFCGGLDWRPLKIP